MKKIFATILLSILLAPTWAIAAPVVVAAIAYAASYITVTQFALTVGLYLYGSAQQRKAEKQQRKQAAAARAQFEAGLRDRTVNTIDAQSPYVYVYGRARVGAAVVGIFTSGNVDQFKHLVCVHAAHECDGFEEFYLNGKKLATLDSSGWVTAAPFYNTTTVNKQEKHSTPSFTLEQTPVDGTFNVTAVTEINGIRRGRPIPYVRIGREVTVTIPPDVIGNFTTSTYQYQVGTPYVNIQKHLGTPGDTVDLFLQARVGETKWPSTSVLSGLCYTVLTLNLNEPEFQGGIPQFEVVLRGKKLYDPRDGTTYWSQNSALALRDYMVSEMCAIPESDLPIDQFITAANVCDEGESFGPRYTTNGTITSDQTQGAVLERLAQAMAGGLVSTGWDVYAGKFTAPVMALQQADIVGSIAITPGLSDADIYNGVRGQYIAEENDYVLTDFVPFQNPTFVEADGRELWTDIDFPFTDEVQRVHNLARVFTEDQRSGFTIIVDVALKAWALKVGQRITFTSEVFGWNSKIFRVTDKRYSPSSSVQLTLKEDAESIWDFADAVLPDPTPNTDLPDPFEVDEITSLRCFSGTDQLIAKDGTVISRILATWPQSTTQAVVTKGTIDIEWQMVGSDVWGSDSLRGDVTEYYISPVEDGSFYTVRVRAVNAYLNVRSDWTYAELHQVIGKTEPPSDVEVFSVDNGIFSWSTVSDLDLAGYVLRFQYGNNAFWGDAAPLHDGIVVATPWQPEIAPPGAVTVMIKAIDTSGNESVNPAAIRTNFGDTIVDNLIFVYDDKAAGFPGDKVNAYVETSGDLVAEDSGDLFWAANNGPFWLADSAHFWPTSTYKQMTYNLLYLVNTDEVGSRLTLLIDIVASSYTIEFRYATQGIFWGLDADFFWGLDANVFWPAPGEWSTWPGEIEDVQAGEIEFRIIAQEGETQGRISEFELRFDVVDESEDLGDVFIDDTGTRLPITKAYRSINNVQLTLQDDGGDAVVAKWFDKSIAGPLVFVYDNAGVPTTGTVDARVQGVKG